MKQKISMFLVVAMLLGCFAAFGVYADTPISVTVDGRLLSFDVDPIMENDRVLVPMRAIFEALGAEVTWDDATRTATAVRGDTTISVTIDNNVLIKNNQYKFTLDVPARLINGRTMVPVRAVAEGLSGALVEWDDAKAQVIITTIAGPTPTSMPAPVPTPAPTPAEQMGTQVEDNVDPAEAEVPIPDSLKDIVVRTYPDGRMKATILSYDDASDWNFEYDEKLINIFNKYGVKCTFNVITGQLSRTTANKYIALGGEHEFASHSIHHDKAVDLGQGAERDAYMKKEAEESRSYLESIFGEGTARGWATPYGYDLKMYRVEQIIKDAGYVYTRTVDNTSINELFTVPKSFYNWKTTLCYQETLEGSAEQLDGYMKQFKELDPGNNMKLFFVWGHGLQFKTQAGWDKMEELSKYIKDNSHEIWNPTCLELVDYVNAVRKLKVVDEGNNSVKITNPSDSITCYVRVNGKTTRIAAGQTVTAQY